MYKLTCGFSLIQPDLYQLTFLCVGRSAEFCASQLHLEQIQWRLQFDTLAYKTKVFCLNTSHILAPPLPYCPEQAPMGACSSSAKKKLVSGYTEKVPEWFDYPHAKAHPEYESQNNKESVTEQRELHQNINVWGIKNQAKFLHSHQ